MSRPGCVGTGSISREGSVQLRWIDLGIGMWHADPAARRYGQQLRTRGKKGGVIGCAMANRANKIAYAMVRDQSGYDPDRWA
jgi:transposase